jgi:hypothetical protein
MLLKKKQGGRSSSQPRLEQLPVKGLRASGEFRWSALKKAKHTPTQSCLPETAVRNRKQRRSLEDITNYARVYKRSHRKIQGDWVNQFSFEMEVGQGAFGEVWKIRDQKGKLKALKVMHKTK